MDVFYKYNFYTIEVFFYELMPFYGLIGFIRATGIKKPRYSQERTREEIYTKNDVF